MNDKTQLQKVMQFFKEYWFIGGIIVSLIVGWTTLSNQVKFQEARIAALEARSNSFDDTLSKISSDVSYIRGRLEK